MRQLSASEKVDVRWTPDGQRRLPSLAFGAGPVSGLMQSSDRALQVATIRTALEAGIDWFDVAPTYGNGAAETNLGLCRGELDAHDAAAMRFATKVRVDASSTIAMVDQVRTTVESSLVRLGVERLSLLQIHNAITTTAGSIPDSITPTQVLAGGLLEALVGLRGEGVVETLGLTGIGDVPALCQVLDSGQFATVQTPFHLLNPSGGIKVGPRFLETNHDLLIARCAERNVAVFAIRVFAGGALARRPPSAHTYQTKYFPLDLYKRDLAAANRLRVLLPMDLSLEEAALRFAVHRCGVASGIVGFGSPIEVRQAVSWANAGPLPANVDETIHKFWSDATR